MGNPSKDSAGKGTKAEELATPPSAPMAMGPDEDYYDLPTDPGHSPAVGADLRPVNPQTASQGQSQACDLDGVTVGRRNAQIEPGRTQGQYDAFILRNLHMFKGEYNGTAITDWVQKVDLLIRLTKVPDEALLPLLCLRVDTQVINYMESLRQRLGTTDYSWVNVKQALLKQFGGVVDPTKQVNDLHSARMGRDTPVRKFAQEVEKRARLAYPELISDVGTPEQKEVQKNILNRITLEQFVSGLPPLLSRPVVEKQITNFNEAVDHAAHLEEINARYFKKTTVNAFFDQDDRRPQAAEPSPPSRPQESAPRYSRTPSWPRQHQGQQPRGQQPRGSRPFENQSHLRQSDNRPSGSDHPTNQSGTRDRRCYKCGMYGHLKFQCVRCFICGDQDHATNKCTNIVCANCKQPGHPANTCSKNSKGHPTSPVTS